MMQPILLNAHSLRIPLPDAPASNSRRPVLCCPHYSSDSPGLACSRADIDHSNQSHSLRRNVSPHCRQVNVTGVCPRCGGPWERVTEVSGETNRQKAERLGFSAKNPVDQGINCAGGHGDGSNRQRTTTGWRPTCTCDAGEPVPATVLDPFVGSGTTLLVARKLGRQGIGLDLSFPYLRDQARPRLSLDALDEWEDGKEEQEAAWEELPLFQDVV